MRSIYLDYNATTPLAAAAQEAMLPYLADRFADPLSEHASGRAVNEALEDARGHVAQAMGATPDEIVWTSGATEACNLALRGLLEPACRRGEAPHLIVSAIDHAAVQGPARYLASIGAELTVVPCDAQAMVDPQQVVDALRPNTRLVSIAHANGEVGSIQPVAQIAARCREEGVLTHTDAAQSFGKEPIDCDALGVDLLSLSAHKAYGPKGVGALFARRGIGVEPLLYGDGQEGGQRSGMPNVAGIVGFGAAARVASESVTPAAERLAKLRDTLRDRLLVGMGEGVVYGPEGGACLANTLCIAMPGVAASNLLADLPEISATPCSGGSGDHVALSPTLRAMAAPREEAAGAIRLSVGWYTDPEEIDHAADALLEAWRRRC